MRPLAFFILLLNLICSAALPASGEKRVALVIGNGAYRAGGALANSVNDAQLVAGALRHANFQTIDTKTDLSISDFRQALRRFQSLADGAEVALIYFAGHGIEANGTNWLIPTDAELVKDRDLEYEAIRLELALQTLQGARMRILALDACRNNPFGRNWRSASRSVSRGLQSVETDDVLVLFAAAPGQTASDGTASNSPFATAFANRIAESGMALQLLGGRVRDDVLRATGGEQRPYVSASITGEPFYLVPSSNSPATTPNKQPSASGPALDPGLADRYLERAITRWHLNNADEEGVRADLSEAIRLNPNLAKAYFERGKSYGRQGNHASAMPDHEAAIGLDPRFADAYVERAVSRWHLDNTDEDRVQADLSEAIRLNPELAMAYLERGKSYSRKGNHPRAKADFDAAIRVDAKLANAYVERGISRWHMNHADEEGVRADLSEAIRLNPNLAKAYFERGLSYGRQGKQALAKADFEAAVRIDPKLAANPAARK